MGASPLVWSLGLHVISRVFLVRAGVRFDASSLPWYWQFIDPALLRTDFWRSVFYLHSQPPLFNAFLGLGLHVSADHTTAFFRYAYIGLGLVFHVALYALLRCCGAPRLGAAAAALLFLVSPAALLYENWLFYSYPLAVGLCVLPVLVYRYVAGLRTVDAVALFTVIAALALTRSVLHLAWCVALLAIVVAAIPQGARRRTLAAASVPLACVLALYVKNAVVFGEFGPSSWLGMNLAKLTVDERAIDRAEREALIRDGTLSPIARIDTFSPLDRYPVSSPRSCCDVPVLTQTTKAANVPNFNHAAYVKISRQYLRDSIALIRARPSIYLRSVGRSFAIFALPASDFWTLTQNREAIRRWDALWSFCLNGAIGPLLVANPTPITSDPFTPRTVAYAAEHAAYGWMALLAITVAISLKRGIRWVRGGGVLPSARGAMLLVIAFTIVFAVTVGNLFEMAENNRFRFMLDALVWAVPIGALASFLETRRSQRTERTERI
jgi:hypothetical protein